MAKKTAKNTQALAPVVLRIRKKDNTLYVRNLDEYPETVQKKLAVIHEVPATKEAIAQAKTLLEQLGLEKAPAKKSEKSEKSEAPAKKQKKKSTPPKFEPRTFELHGQTYVEAHPNKRNFNGMLFVLISEKEVTHSKTGKKLKKPRTETVYQLVECMRVCTNTVWFLDHETEDAFPVRPEQVQARKIWEMDEDGNYTEEQKQNVVAELVPVTLKKSNEQGE